jgi:lipopolysaccharide/colanic/teichoic acid biosynthesis glycosyltransferase
MKRIFDFIYSGVVLVLVSPLLLWAAWRIHREDGGPVLYRGERVGRYGKIFRILKFRTMVVDAEKIGGSSTAQGDPRITRIGRRLRKLKLDELPQFFNVLVGEMSIVGPRPEVKYYTDLFTEEEKAILSVRPGITDWASIWNYDEGSILAGAADPEAAYLNLIRPTKVRLQQEYVRRQSFFTDLKIIFYTVATVLVGPRAREAALKPLWQESSDSQQWSAALLDGPSRESSGRRC